MQEGEKEKRMWGGVSLVPVEPVRGQRRAELKPSPKLTSDRQSQGGTATMGDEEGLAAEKRMWGGVSDLRLRSALVGLASAAREGVETDHSLLQGGTAVMREGAGQDAEKRMWGGVCLPLMSGSARRPKNPH